MPIYGKLPDGTLVVLLEESNLERARSGDPFTQTDPPNGLPKIMVGVVSDEAVANAKSPKDLLMYASRNYTFKPGEDGWEPYKMFQKEATKGAN